MNMLNIKSISKSYDKAKSTYAIKNISVKIPEGKIITFVGPSGSGKTTLLKCVAGLIETTEGQTRLDNKIIKNPGRDIGMVFQNYSLFPWLTVEENIKFGLSFRDMKESEIQEIVKYYLAATGLKEYRKSYPRFISQGMQQRVALARTLANKPKVILMDEPFGSLDPQTRSLMQELLLVLWEKEQKTIVLVTHDIDEAIFLSDEVHVLSTKPGEIKTTLKIDLKRPRNHAIRTSKKFLQIKNQINYVIRGESIKASKLKLSNINPNTIKIGLHTWAGVTPFYYAEDRGYFMGEDVEIELVPLEKEEDRITAFKKGEIDILHLTPDSIHRLEKLDKLSCDIVLLMDDSVGGDALITTKKIKNVKELSGKKIGVEKGLFSHFFLVSLLKKNKLTVKDIELIHLSGSEIGENLLRGDIDAAILWEPWLSGIKNTTNSKVLASTKTDRHKIISVLLAKKSFIKKHKQEIEKIQKVWDKSVFEIQKETKKHAPQLASYLGISENDFLLQVGKLEFISEKNRAKYQKLAKDLIIEGRKLWPQLKKVK